MKDINNSLEIHNSEKILDYEINNVVATAKIDTTEKFKLENIAQKLPDSEYFPERFPGLIFRLNIPRATFLIFSTGKMVITGLRFVSNANIALKKFLKKIKKYGVKITEPLVTIQNIVASGDFHTFIDLNKAVLIMEYVMYEPEVFPGLIYNMKDPRAVFLLFSTGKYVCTGIKKEEVLKTAISKITQKIKNMNITKEIAKEEKYELKFL
ncbi:MAG: TATA-box-binding protein [Candidatus Odinarchaeota archaeon]